MEQQREVSRVWRCYRTIKELVRDRGYNVSQADIDMPLEEFRARFVNELGQVDRSRLNFQAACTPEAAEKYGAENIGTLWVGFSPEEASVGVKTMRDFCIHIQQYKFTVGLFIYQQSLTPSANKLIPTVAPAVIETFQESDLVVNITKHVLVPRHIRLSESEKKELLERYKLKESQLPRIQREDPVARYFGLRKGQVVKIIRRSETAGRYASYRICL